MLLIAAALANPNYVSGSDGSAGPILVSTGETLAWPLPEDGIVHATSVTVEAGGLLVFTRNTYNTPVRLLATDAVVIAGTVSVSGEDGTPTAAGAGGPGGFDGGAPGMGQGVVEAGRGRGPGGGQPFLSANLAYSGASAPVQQRGFALIGGSGGGGVYVQGPPSNQESCGGGGGGGALVIASTASITVDGVVESRGGLASAACVAQIPPTESYKSGGGGGTLRLVAPSVGGTGSLDVSHPVLGEDNGGHIRVDTLRPGVDDVGLTLHTRADRTFHGDVLVTYPLGGVNPRVVIDEVDGNAIDELTGPDFVSVPPGGSTVYTTLRVVDPGSRARWQLCTGAFTEHVEYGQGHATSGCCTVADASVSPTCVAGVDLQDLRTYTFTAYAR
ncbi:MAG: hypothetical protein KC656_04450 [Myxococcales bacterium]|nr:hypothetical protein [Myxococcales bacterium]